MIMTVFPFVIAVMAFVGFKMDGSEDYEKGRLLIVVIFSFRLLLVI